MFHINFVFRKILLQKYMKKQCDAYQNLKTNVI